MEFPHDVLSIIRAYSRPRFKYFREYNSARKRFRLLYFPNIKPCLYKNPERILPSLKRLEYWDEEYIRLSKDFQKRYWEYVDSGEVEIKRRSVREVLDELLYAREEVCCISYQKN
jgi:hypothetical protein